MSLYIERIVALFQEPTFTLLFFLVIIWGNGMLFKKIGLPIMFGEMMAGLILGPPILNIIKPDVHILWLAELGVFFLIFFTGMEMDIEKLKETSGEAILVAFGGTFIPFVLGFFISRMFGGDILQALFVGMAISVTSIATKARVLHELGILNKKIGHLMVNAALYDNIFSLILFACIISFVRIGKIDFHSVMYTSIEIVVFFIVTIYFGYYVFPKLKKFFSPKGAGGFTFCLVIALLFGFFAEIVGLHFIMGVFLAGIFLRKEVMATTELYDKMHSTMYAISYGFLGPIFFLTISFHVNLEILYTNLLFFLIILTAGAMIGKVFGATLFTLIAGYKFKESLIVGLGMNGRGMVEIALVVVGLEHGILTNNVVSVLVFMVLLTTLITPLALKLLVGKTPK